MRCTNCGATLSPEDKFCRECGAARPGPGPRLPPGFAEVRRQFADVQRQYQAGDMDEAVYEARLQELVVEDEKGGYWAPGADSGDWYWYDGSQWVRRDPVTGSPPAPSAPPPSRRAFPWLWVAVGGGGLMVLVIVAGLLLVPRLLSAYRQSPPPALIVTDTPTPMATAASSAAEVTPVVALQASATVTAAAQPTATGSPTAAPTSSPTSAPTDEPTLTLTPSPEPTATPTATPQPQATPTQPEPTAAPASGALIDFEQWGTWRRGDQPYGELSQTESQVHSGRYAAELRYDFPATDDDFVVFVRPVSLAGQPNKFSAWVYGDGSGNYLNIWVEDAQGETWAVHLGRIGGAGWQFMAGTLSPDLAWPSGHVYGPDNGTIDYPVRFYALVLDRVGSGSRTGRIMIDDVSASRGAAAEPPAATAVPNTPVATAETPVSAGPLDFPEPTWLDGWQPVANGREVTIVVHISGGAPPFTVSHQGQSFQTQQRDYPLKFVVNRCEIFGTIIVESADGQRVSHDYWIDAPWCN